MSEELVYDPRTKQLIKDRIYSHLYAPVKRDYEQRLESIILKNSQYHGNGQRWMSFRGTDYSLKEAGPQPLPTNRCHPELKGVMQEYVDELSQLINEEVPYVLGFITHTLNTSNSPQDYLRVFPQSVHQPIQSLVDTYGYQHEHLSDEKVDELIRKHEKTIEMVKKRMVLNLLL